jgi:perosamine synthetase
MEYIPVNEPLLNGNEKKYLDECIDTGWISSDGPYVKQFEQNMASYVGRKYGIAVSNGTAALDIAVTALQLTKGDEVIMPDFTIISCASALVKQGVKPVLVDADPETWNMDVTQIENKITGNTKAIMVVHIYGLPVDMAPVLKLAQKYDIRVIEDAAEAHGLKYKGKMCGSFGDISIMSFYPNKHVTTGEGGMVLTDDEYLAERCRLARNLFFRPERRYVHDELGFNYRMSNLQAAVGVAQLEKIDEHLKIKRNIGRYYQQELRNDRRLILPVETTEYAENIYWVFGVVMKNSNSCSCIEAIRRLGENGIGCRTFFYPMHLQPVFIKMGLFSGEKYPVSEMLGEKGFYIPSGLALSEQQMVQVVKIVEKTEL